MKKIDETKEYKQLIKYNFHYTKRSKNVNFLLNKSLSATEARHLIKELEFANMAKYFNVSESLLEYLFLTNKCLSNIILKLKEGKSKENWNNVKLKDFEFYIENKEKELIELKSFLKNISDNLLNNYRPEFDSLIYENDFNLDRKIHFYIGPTNSGKTHQALSKITSRDRAVYLAPLRLLAIEIYEKMNANGIPCSLITGEERIIVENAKMVSSTIEMFNSNAFYDIAIIDEYQLINSSDRGGAYTRALINLNCSNIYLLGDPTLQKSTQDFISKVRPDDIFEITHFNRRSSLQWNEHKIINMDQIRKGDAVIFFSKKDVLGYAEILSQKGFKVSILYGDLPVDTRRKQSENFLNGLTDIVVATDVIGMGLNLPIERVVFGSLRKFDGVISRNLNQQELKQIAGRAGRDYNVGFVCGLLEGRLFESSRYDDCDCIFLMNKIFEKSEENTQQYFPFTLNESFLAKLAIETETGLNAYALYQAFVEEAKQNENGLIYQFDKKGIKFYLSAKIKPELIPCLNQIKHLTIEQKIKLCAPPINYMEEKEVRYGYNTYLNMERTEVGEYYYDMLKNNNFHIPYIPTYYDRDYMDIDVGIIEKKLSVLKWLNYELKVLSNEKIEKAYKDFSYLVQRELIENFVLTHFEKQRKILNRQKAEATNNQFIHKLKMLKQAVELKLDNSILIQYLADPLTNVLMQNNSNNAIYNGILSLNDELFKQLIENSYKNNLNKKKWIFKHKKGTFVWKMDLNFSKDLFQAFETTGFKQLIKENHFSKLLFDLCLERKVMDEKNFKHRLSIQDPKYVEFYKQIFDLLLVNQHDVAKDKINEMKQNLENLRENQIKIIQSKLDQLKIEEENYLKKLI